MSSIIELKPLTRVEGHGKISVYMAGRRVEDIHLDLYESPRLFETLLVGKGYGEVPEIICRICSLCSTVHRVTALLAVEKALGIEVSRQTSLFRQLIINGGHIQSHALHLFCLVLPDLFEVSGFTGLARKEPELLAMGLRLKGVGNLLQEVVGGRLIHPVTLIPGGMGKPPHRRDMIRMKEALQQAAPEAVEACRLFAGASPGQPRGVLPPPRYLALRPSIALFFGSEVSTGTGSPFSVDTYRDHLREQAVPGSNAKGSTFNGDAVTTGAVARLNLGLPLSTSASHLLSEHEGIITEADIMANNLCQAVELVEAIERSITLIDTLLDEGYRAEPPRPPARPSGTGTAAMEAPRGILIHSYSFADDGRCTAADIITPTAINQAAMKRDLLALARSMEGTGEAEMKHQLEVLVRAYDPCISCAVHLVSI